MAEEGVFALAALAWVKAKALRCELSTSVLVLSLNFARLMSGKERCAVNLAATARASGLDGRASGCRFGALRVMEGLRVTLAG